MVGHDFSSEEFVTVTQSLMSLNVSCIHFSFMYPLVWAVLTVRSVDSCVKKKSDHRRYRREYDGE